MMKKKLFVFLIGFLFIGVNVFAGEVLTRNGTVGTSNSVELAVNGTTLSPPMIQVGTEAGSTYITHDTQGLQIQDENQNTMMKIDNTSGNVGIGVANPGAKLEVDGDIKVPMYTQWCSYGTNPGNPTCTCRSGYYALDCGRNHYNPMTLYNTGTGCYAETINGYTDVYSALVVRCAMIHE